MAVTQTRWTRRPEGSNWGDFGPDDQVGRLNLLTPAHRVAAAREVQAGRSFCLSLPLDYPGGNALFHHRRPPQLFHAQREDRHNFNFPVSRMGACFCDVVSDDAVTLYTQYSTQWDGLGHVGQMFDATGNGVAEKVYYNGYRAGIELVGPDEGSGELGARAIGIEHMATAGVQGRGVLLDLHALHGRTRALVDYDGVMQALAAQGATVEAGDFLCLYTGFADLVLEMRRTPDAQVLAQSCAVLDGRDPRLLQWITHTGIVAICADNLAVEAYPARPGEGARYAALPLHEHCIFKLGMHLGELWHFAELAQYLRAAKRSRFLLTAPPLRLPGAVGSPVTPLATV